MKRSTSIAESDCYAVRFHLTSEDCYSGYSFHVVGSIPELGNWKALPSNLMSPTATDSMFYKLMLSESCCEQVD